MVLRPRYLLDNKELSNGDMLTWDQVYWQLKNIIKVRHLSMNRCAGWFNSYLNASA